MDKGSKKKPELINKVVQETKVTPETAPEPVKVPVLEEIKEELVVSEEISKPAQNASIAFEELLSKWTQVFDRVPNALAKRCLMAAKPVGLENHNLRLAFSSNFSKEKLFVPELLAICEKAIEETTGVHIKMEGEVNAALFAAEIAAASPKPEPSVNVMDSALNVFGGELVG